MRKTLVKMGKRRKLTESNLNTLAGAMNVTAMAFSSDMKKKQKEFNEFLMTGVYHNMKSVFEILDYRGDFSIAQSKTRVQVLIDEQCRSFRKVQ